MYKLRYLVPLVAALGTGTALADGWTVAAETSSVGFTAEQQGGKFNGKFDEFSAEINFDPASPAGGSIVGVVMTESVDTRDYDRDAALTDKDWFDPVDHPEATFASTGIEAGSDGMFVAHGNLTIKGTTKPVDLTFSFKQDGAAAMFDGTMSIDRFDFNVGQGWNDTYMVGKEVVVQVKLDLHQ